LKTTSGTERSGFRRKSALEILLRTPLGLESFYAAGYSNLRFDKSMPDSNLPLGVESFYVAVYSNLRFDRSMPDSNLPLGVESFYVAAYSNLRFDRSMPMPPSGRNWIKLSVLCNTRH
jgi:hypothetical protein